jgi:hypothetical protein
MPLFVQTGRQLSIEIDSVNYSVQTSEVTLTPSQSVDQYISLTSNAAISGPVTFELGVKAFQDWGEAASFCDALVTAAAAGTPIPFEMGLPNGGTATGSIIPVYPVAGGAADSALEIDLTFAVTGAVTFA